MKEYNGYTTKEEYLRHIQKALYKNGMKCMILSIIIFGIILLFGIKEMIAVANVFGISEKIFMLIPKMTVVIFIAGAIGCYVSNTIKVESTDK